MFYDRKQIIKTYKNFLNSNGIFRNYIDSEAKSLGNEVMVPASYFRNKKVVRKNL